jgi:hypothetical protein
MKDAAVMCLQSPGARNRHVQTVKNVSINVKCNTDPIKTVTVSTSMDNIVSEWGEMDSNTTSECWRPIEDFSDRDCESSVPHPIQMQNKTFEGPSGLPDLLNHMGVSIPDMDQYSDLINDKTRNVKAKYVIQEKFRSEGMAEVRELEEYYVVMDDLIVSFSETDDGRLSMGRYIKLYGDFKHLLFTSDGSSVYAVLDKKHFMSKRCKEELMFELYRVLVKVRSCHTRCGYERW